MTCREAEALVMPYLRNQLTDEELEGFLEHIEECANCREELEIYYTVEIGIRQLDTDTGSYNIKGALEAAITASKQRLYSVMVVKIMKYAVNTLCVMSLIIIFLLQFRIWIQQGIF